MNFYKGRSKWKSLNFTSLLKESELKKSNLRKNVVSYLDIGKKLRIHKGNRFIKLRITDKMVKYKLGQFIITKKLGSTLHKNKKKEKKKRKYK